MSTARVGIVLCKRARRKAALCEAFLAEPAAYRAARCSDRGFARFLDAADQPGAVLELQLRRHLKANSYGHEIILQG
jgi:hypothetical protein